MKTIKHHIEAAGLNILLFILSRIPLSFASWIGAFVAQSFGTLTAAHKTAGDNLGIAFPTMSDIEKSKLLIKMWRNLGRNAAEIAHLQNDNIVKRIKIINKENLPAHGKPALMFSGHLGNWELLAHVAEIGGRPVTGVYREANNPLTNNLINRQREKRYFGLIPKGAQGAIKIVRAIKNNEAIAMLVDQKMNDGISVSFFGHEAMTAPAIAELALRYDMPIIPARVIRTGGCNFKTIIYPPLAFEKTDNREQDIYNIMLKINQTLEGWIREYPEQWFWVHKRWPKEHS